MSGGAYVLGVLCLVVALSEWSVRRTWTRHLGTALLVILVTAVLANLGVLPAGSTAEAPVPVYDGIFAFVAPLSIFWLLLRVHLRDVLRAGGPALALFAAGAVGTATGVLLGMALVDGADAFGEQFAAMGGMFTGTYIGGSINFNAVALEYDVVREGGLYAGAVVVDNVLTTVWMIATLALPRLLAPLWPRTTRGGAPPHAPGAPAGIEADIAMDTEAVHPLDLALLGVLGLGTLVVSDAVAAAVGIPSILTLTAIALGLAQVPAVARLRGAQALGMFSIYLFLAVVGAFCDLAALGAMGELGFAVLGLAATAIGVHGALTFGVARALRLDLQLAAMASQANVGGGTTALALARSMGRQDLVLPAVLLGALGNGLGTFVAFGVAGVLPRLLG